MTAQDVVPLSLDGVEGGGGTSIPFGSGLECRYQCLYEAGELPWVGPRVITGLRIRPDFNSGNPTPAKGFLTVSVLLSTTHKTVTTVSSEFDENYGSDATWVVQNRIVQLPAQPQLTGAGPRPFNIEFAFNQPWVYGLTPATTAMPAPDSLLLEISIQLQVPGTYRVDNLSSCSSSGASFGVLGPSCLDGGQPVELTSAETMLAGASYTWTVSTGTPSSAVFLALNLTNQGALFGDPAFPLPYPMFDPANPSLPSPLFTLFGASAPDCYLNIEPAALNGAIADASGVAAISLPLPAGTQFVGTTLYSQAIVFAPTANPLRLVTSLGHESTICGPLGVTRIHSFYDSATAPTPTSGSVSQGVGLVLEFF